MTRGAAAAGQHDGRDETETRRKRQPATNPAVAAVLPWPARGTRQPEQGTALLRFPHATVAPLLPRHASPCRSAEQEGEDGLASLVAWLTVLDGMGGAMHDHQLAQG